MTLMGKSKSSIRFGALNSRSGIDEGERVAKNAAIRERLFSLKEFSGVRKVFFYASFGKEVDTIESLKRALREGKTVMLPKIERSDMTLEIYEIDSAEGLEKGYMGIPEPHVSAEHRRRLRDIELVVVPGVAFDPTGGRLGYGKGCYDRLLANTRDLPPLVGIAFEEQMVDEIPSEPHDLKLDIIITDKRTIYCNGH